MGVTPCVIPVARKGWDKMITVAMPGYQTEIFELDSTLSGTTFLNVLWWPGAIVDGISGRGGKYQDNVKIVLIKGSGVNDHTQEEEENED